MEGEGGNQTHVIIYRFSMYPLGHKDPATINDGFGGDDWKTLYFTSRAYLVAAVTVNIAGVPVPTPKKS
jgi:hypothetical protein